MGTPPGYTGGVDSFRALLKRGFLGTHHKMPSKHLPLYLNEFTYRLNHKENTGMFVDVPSNGLIERNGVNGDSA